MTPAITAVVFVLALVLLVSWLGGGRKWAFRTMLSLLVLGLLGACGVLGYVLWTEKSAERQRQRIHECAVAKIATARCEQPPSTQSSPADPKPYEKKAEHGPWEKYQKKDDSSKWVDYEVCPPYELPNNPTREQEADAMTAAEKACWAEIGPQQKSVSEQVSEYRRKHGIKESTTAARPQGDIFDRVVTACAAKVRKKYPGSYDDLDDSTLVKKVLARYPKYCEANSGDPAGWEPVIEGIR